MNKNIKKHITWVLALAALAVGQAAAVEVWFGEAVSVRDKYRELIRGADNDVTIAMDRFTDYTLADACIDAVNRGRRVRVILDGDKRNVLVGKALGDHLAGGGVEVQYDRSESNLYDRFVVIDDHTVVVGSYPFIEDAPSSPMTDAVVIEDEDVARQYLEYFDFVWNLTK
jgi:phosphatidylserine/phosphatidylglycerophosphate/cardiolipin synthase-like enzyme